MKKILIGIDPSFVDMGVALYNPATKEMTLKSGTFTDCVNWINANCKISEAIAVVENPALDSTTFGMWAMFKKILEAYVDSIIASVKMKIVKKATTIEEVRSVFSIAMNHAQKVGENKAAAKHTITLLRDHKVPVIEIAPSKRDKSFKKDKKTKRVIRQDVRFLKMPTKTTQAQFEKLTGYSGRSSEHARDAATLVFDRSIAWASNMVQIEDRKPKSTPATNNSNYFIVKREEEDRPLPF